jgi:predicted ArsR family transcriptional regulator
MMSFKHIRVRASDPITSFMAADEVHHFASKHSNAILECLAFGPAGKDGIAAHIGLDGHQVGKRLTELEREGLVMVTGAKVRSKSGRFEREWRLVIPC